MKDKWRAVKEAAADGRDCGYQPSSHFYIVIDIIIIVVITIVVIIVIITRPMPAS